MKRIINVGHTSNKIDIALLLARVAVSLMMLTHGLPKMAQLLSGDPIQFPPVLGMSSAASLGVAVFAEVLCSILLLVGFTTRLAAIPLMITMLVAVLLIHSADAFAQKEMALHYLVAYIVLFIAGSGKYSVDYLLQRRLTVSATIA